MTIAEYQHQTDQWIRIYGKRYFDERTNALLLVEEVGEFSRLIARKYGEQSFKNPQDERTVDSALEEELGDILFVCCCLANQMNIDLEEVIKENFIKKTARDSTRHIENKKL
jgi:NTP pyrophosphatase (non-canonical NTP hydrolase)